MWESKVVRSAAGAHFRLNLIGGVQWDLMAGNYVSEDSTVILADSAVPEEGVSRRKWSREELASRLMKADERSSELKSVEVLENGQKLHRDASYLDGDLLRVYRHLPLESAAYHDLKLRPGSKEVVLVVGGEAHGLSSAAHKLAHDLGGSKVQN